MTRRYETVYIFDSALEEPAITEKLQRFHGLLATDGAAATPTVNHWGKRTLAYPVKKKETGYYVVAQFETAPNRLPEFERAVKLDESVLRFLVIAAEGEQPRPPRVSTPAPDDEPIALVEEDA
jgi:small subunit ribosomal protein S6